MNMALAAALIAGAIGALIAAVTVGLMMSGAEWVLGRIHNLVEAKGGRLQVCGLSLTPVGAQKCCLGLMILLSAGMACGPILASGK